MQPNSPIQWWKREVYSISNIFILTNFERQVQDSYAPQKFKGFLAFVGQ